MDFDAFIKEFTKKESSDYYKRFWAGTAIENGLTIKYDGKELLVKPQDISCIDLGELSGRCLCGHPIRYEYWFDTLGPIGSTCITVMTGLNGSDLRTIMRGSQFALKEKNELVKLKEKYQTLENQYKEFALLETKIKKLHELDKIPEKVQNFLQDNIPMPYSVRRIIDKIYDEINQESLVMNRYGKEVYECFQIYYGLGQEIRNIVQPMELLVPAAKSSITHTLFDIGGKIGMCKATTGQVEYFKKIVTRLKNPKFIDACDVLTKLKQITLGEFWDNVVTENIQKAVSYGLSEGQINFILDKSAAGKPGLATRFKDKLNFAFEENIDNQEKLENNIAAENDAIQQADDVKMGDEIEEEPPRSQTEVNPW